jgi:Putative DNA-binding domain
MNSIQSNSNRKSVSTFAHEWAVRANAQSILHFASSNFGAFGEEFALSAKSIKNFQEIVDGSKFDLILGDFPLGLNQTTWDANGTAIKAQQNWIEIAKSLTLLNHSGNALFLLEPLAFSKSKGVIFEKMLNNLGYFVNGIFDCPVNLLQPATTIRPVIVAISKAVTERLYIAELLSEEQAKQVVDNYFSTRDSGDLVSGTYIEKSDYHGFNRIKIRQQIERLETQYKTFGEHRLGDLACEINSVRNGDLFHERANAIYIPNFGASPVVGCIEDAKLQHHNYFQVVFQESTISEYLVAFFRSTLGRMILNSMVSQTFTHHFNKKDLEQLLIALPSTPEQQSIIVTLGKLQKLKNAIQTFDAQLALNPTSSETVLGQLDTMLDAIGSLTSADRVRGLVREGETKTIEFKKTLSLDVKTMTKEKHIETSALKTVVAFLNTEGGTLLIGVSDDGSISGISAEILKLHKNTDKFMLHLKNLIKDRIGEDYYPFIDCSRVDVDGNPIVVVECKSSQDPCYLDKAEFYVRTNPATDKLDGPKLVAYVRNHFSS